MCFSEVSVASTLDPHVRHNITLVLVHNSGVHKVFQRSFGSNVHTALRVRGPAVVPLVPVVVGVRIGSVLDTVVALAVKPVLALVVGWLNACALLGPPSVCKHIQRNENLRNRDQSLADLTKPTNRGTEMFCLVSWRVAKKRFRFLRKERVWYGCT